jgi:hypothetical protein
MAFQTKPEMAATAMLPYGQSRSFASPFYSVLLWQHSHGRMLPVQVPIKRHYVKQPGNRWRKLRPGVATITR